MTRESKQIGETINAIVRNLRGRVAGVWLVVVLVLVGGYLVAEPTMEAWLGVDLPGVSSPDEVGEQANESTRNQSKTPTSGGKVESQTGIEEILDHVENDVFVSPAGLRYTKGSVHGHRLKHLMAHTRDEPNRPGPHGVFDSTDAAEVVKLVDEAFLQALSGKKSRQEIERDRTVYAVDMGRRIGYVGGETGQRQGHPVARYLQIVVETDEAGPKFITAYPIRNW